MAGLPPWRCGTVQRLAEVITALSVDMISQVAKSICHLHPQIELILYYRLWGLYNINVITSSGLQT